MYQSTCIYFSTYVHFEACLSSISTEISIFCFYSVHFEAWFFFNKYQSSCLPFLFSTFWSLIFFNKYRSSCLLLSFSTFWSLIFFNKYQSSCLLLSFSTIWRYSFSIYIGVLIFRLENDSFRKHTMKKTQHTGRKRLWFLSFRSFNIYWLF